VIKLSLKGKPSNGQKESKKSTKQFKPKFLITTEKGIRYIPTGELWEYPLFVGKTVVHNIGPEELKIEFLHEGKGYVFIFYDENLGMVAKARIDRRHAYYILQELISRRGQVPVKGMINDKKIREILQTAKMTRYRSR